MQEESKRAITRDEMRALGQYHWTAFLAAMSNGEVATAKQHLQAHVSGLLAQLCMRLLLVCSLYQPRLQCVFAWAQLTKHFDSRR